MNDLVDFVAKFPQGVSAGEIELQLKIGRSTLNRRLREAVSAGDLIAVGNGSARRYCPGDALAAIKAYMSLTPNVQSRPIKNRCYCPRPVCLMRPWQNSARCPRMP